MKRPLIAITATCQAVQASSYLMGVNNNYQEAVYRAGGLPVCLPPLNDLSAVSDLDQQFAGFLFTGGPDLPAEYYGKPDHPAMHTLLPRRAAWDMALAKKLLNKSEKPILGICLGCQEINVASGGDLYQHLPEVSKNIGEHSRKEGAPENMHSIVLEKDSQLAEILGATTLDVNSSHHQAICRVAPGFRVVARSEKDAVIEAIEAEDALFHRRFLLCVQWHPERIQQLVPQQKLFAAFIEACR
ncbi:MAG: gamma-glutamyl-gamma-aminobutyrate hydrolase family protein [Lentisphaeria bacterium]